MQELYHELWLSFQRREITQEEWLDSANAILELLLVEIDDSLIKLKSV